MGGNVVVASSQAPLGWRACRCEGLDPGRIHGGSRTDLGRADLGRADLDL
jgi:hypothetical protein